MEVRYPKSEIAPTVTWAQLVVSAKINDCYFCPRILLQLVKPEKQREIGPGDNAGLTSYHITADRRQVWCNNRLWVPHLKHVIISTASESRHSLPPRQRVTKAFCANNSSPWSCDTLNCPLRKNDNSWEQNWDTGDGVGLKTIPTMSKIIGQGRLLPLK